MVNGYKLELAATPTQQSQPVTMVTHTNQSLVEAEIQKLQDKGAIRMVNPCPGQYVSRIFLVPKKDGSSRLVVNLRPLNRFMLTAHFKMESLVMIKDLLQEGDWMGSIDLKDAYLSVTVCGEHRKLLRFSCMGTLYEFQSLPFGLCSAPRVFTKLLKPVLAMLRHQGIRLIMYLDDLLVMAQSKQELERQIHQIISLLELLGFVVNREKSQLLPTQVILYLGFLINSKEMKIKMADEKVTQLMALCSGARQKRILSVRELATLLGKMTSTLPAIFQAPLWYRELQRLKNQALWKSESFDDMVTLNEEALLELEWWSTKVNLVNGKSVRPRDPDLIVETDASLQGWGAVCRGIRTGGMWSQEERENHINYLELLAASFAVKAFTKDQENVHVHVRMDNRTAVFYVNRMGGTRSPQVNRLAIQLWRWCLEKNLSLSAEYLPGVENCIADEESRSIQSSAEWKLQQGVFQQIVGTFGECTIDLFASRLNAQLEQYVSWRPDPGAVGTDALQLTWNKGTAYAFPPFCLIGRCLKKVREERASLVLVAPIWRSQPWYPALLELLTDYPVVLPRNPELLSDPAGNPHPLMIVGQLQLAAWKLSGIDRLQQEFQRKLPNCWQQDGVGGQTQHTKVHGRDGIAGVLNSKLIHFHVLSNHSLSS